jgi:hypothetical protein
MYELRTRSESEGTERAFEIAYMIYPAWTGLTGPKLGMPYEIGFVLRVAADKEAENTQ